MPLLQFVNRVWFEQGAVRRIGGELGRLAVRRPLVCVDKGIVAAGIVDAVKAHWPAEMPWILFDETPANPTESAVRAALALYRAERCDGIVAIGGGSPIDLGKAVNLLVGHPEPLAKYETAKKGLGKIGPVGPLIAVPTTAGTGTEVSVGTVIITDDGRKSTIASPHLIPAAAICDPALTLGLPKLMTAATGMDAVTHCVEAYLSPLYNPIADAIGLDGLSRAVARGALERAVSDGSDVTARTEMMMAALEGALAFTKGLGAVHAMSHAAARIEGLKLHHGTLNAVILPTVLRFNAPHCAPKMAALARAMELPDAAALPEAIEKLNARLGLPRMLLEMGVVEAAIPELVAYADADVSSLTNPVRPTREDYARLFAGLVSG
ncbi:iron-containing alcohol dehydrogenase [Xanthobacter autotrophicus]|uniref:iron-containing alcohol dehydrogenase n=1 Tax=Xanthobacter autotrophicus TaxID=280 RepID=UPI001E5CCE6B|nr:iron-containing alcohol dehydrogenase [Xanthobacter autotrophicus]UDQ91055.1 iron-containing alcohol dehydrogenase [Xanthobacter autotrophicus]